MPGHDEMTTVAEPGTRPQDEQSRLSRRSALRTAAAAGITATALAATSAPALAAARPTRASGDGERPEADPGEPIVAHLRNARTGEIDVFRGTSQTRLRDPALAALLVRASR